MSKWKVGPVEPRITPPMKHAITIYKGMSPLLVYVCTSGFTVPTKAERQSVETIAQVIADTLNKEQP